MIATAKIAYANKPNKNKTIIGERCMTESAEKIRKVLEEHRRRDARPLDENIQMFIEEFERDVRKTLEDKYGDFAEIKPIEDKSVLEMKAAMTAQEIRTKGYAYDSLCFRYRDARFKQARLEMENDYRKGIKEHGEQYYMEMAKRDFMRFCMILDDVIGEHD